MTTHKIHDIATLKTLIKANAAETRAKREEARTLTGMDRWYAQRKAEWNADSTRCLLLAYGYLRGKTISQMESPYSDPDEIPSPESILDISHAVFNKGPDASEENQADWDEFEQRVREDFAFWKSKVRTSHAMRAAQQRVA